MSDAVILLASESRGYGCSNPKPNHFGSSAPAVFSLTGLPFVHSFSASPLAPSFAAAPCFGSTGFTTGLLVFTFPPLFPFGCPGVYTFSSGMITDGFPLGSCNSIAGCCVPTGICGKGSARPFPCSAGGTLLAAIPPAIGFNPDAFVVPAGALAVAPDGGTVATTATGRLCSPLPISLSATPETAVASGGIGSCRPAVIALGALATTGIAATTGFAAGVAAAATGSTTGSGFSTAATTRA